MNEILIRASFKILYPLLSAISLVFFLRGHNLPGGGFIGGLILSLALILRFLSHSESRIEKYIVNYFPAILSLSLIGLFIVAVLPLFMGKNVLTGLWTTIPLPIAGKLSSILFFDLFISIHGRF